MDQEPERQVFDTFFKIHTLMHLMFFILPGLFAYMSAVFVVYFVAQCGSFFSPAVDVVTPRSGASSSLARLLSSPDFFLALAFAVGTQYFSSMFVICVATFYRANALFRAHAMPILAALGTSSDFFIFFFKPVADAASNIAFLRAGRLLDVPGEFDLPLLLPAAAVYLAESVSIAALCHTVPDLRRARGRGFGAMRRRLVLVAAGKFYAAAAVISLLGGFFIAGMMAFPSQSRMVDSGTAMIPVMYCTMVVVMLGAQPVVYLVFLKNFRP